jgi:serine protease
MTKIYFSLLFLFFSIPVFAQDINHVPGNLLVMLNSENEAGQLQKDLSFIEGINTKLKLERSISSRLHIYLFTFDPSSINEEKMLAKIKKHPDVKIAQFNHYISERNTFANDPLFSGMWEMNNDGTNGGTGSVADADIDAPEAWDITTGGTTFSGDTIVVAVIDVGF